MVHSTLFSRSQPEKHDPGGDNPSGYIQSPAETEVYIDAEGSPIGMQYRNSQMDEDEFYTFWFEKNLQGDVVAVYNASGTKIISYTYDAWGNVTQSTLNSTGSNDYAWYNPFRYRGYYCDIETELYYLNSRYYDPATGRFINADGQLNGGLLGYNMFAYCMNNPVNMSDPMGDWPKWIENIARWVDDNIIQPVTKFVDDIIEDCKNYDSSNTDIETVYNSHYFSSYKGKKVIRFYSKPIESFAVANTIFLNHKDDESLDPVGGLNHEYGHTQQEKELGTAKYIFVVAIPSVICNVISGDGGWLYDNYYNLPWEYDADMRGGVSRSVHTERAKSFSKWYFAIFR